MSFRILYVENTPRDFIDIETAVKHYNDKSTSERLTIIQAKDPEDLRDKLDFHFDIILADIYFNDPITGKRDAIPRLEDIINYVDSWGNEQNGGRPLPIIAYSGRATLQECLSRKDLLYDIWDKNTTTPEYVVWRLSKLALEITRVQPDSHLQRLIRGMPSGSFWHNSVIEMARGYNSGRTEYDQIEKAGSSVQDIAHKLLVWEECKPMWEAMMLWEPLGRAASRKVRGHARHVVNVFWLGYYLLNHDMLQNWFIKRWQFLVDERAKMGEVKDENPLEALSCIWFYTGLFHDIGNCIEKIFDVNEYYRNILKLLGNLEAIVPEMTASALSELAVKCDELLHDIGLPLYEIIKPILKNGFEDKKPDHGFLSGLILRNFIKIGKQACYVREASRSIALHNIIGNISGIPGTTLSWEEEPIACLLMLCDQIQTWDRERGDSTFMDQNSSERAELLNLKIIPDSKRTIIEAYIDYIAPDHVLRSPEMYLKLKEELKLVLRKKPNRALRTIAKPWPFALKMFFSLSRENIMDMSFE